MLIRNITSSRDLENKKRLQAEMLQAQIDNEKILDERVRDYKNPNKPPAVPPQYKSNSEVLADSLEQQKEAIENLRSLGLGFDVAAQTSIELKNLPDGIANLVKLNKNFPFIKTDILKRYNVKLLDPKVLVEYFKEYFDNIDNIIGISIPSTSSTNYFDKGVSTSLIATKDDYERLNTALDIVYEKTNMGAQRKDELKRANNRIIDISPNDAQLQSINTLDAITRNNLKKEMEKLMKKYPSGKSINEITDNLIRAVGEEGVPTSALANANEGGIDISQNMPESVYKTLSIFTRLLKNISPVEMKQLSDFTEKLKEQENELKQKESEFYEKYDTGEESKGQELTEIKIPKEIVEQQERALKDIVKHRQNIELLNKVKAEKEKIAPFTPKKSVNQADIDKELDLFVKREEEEFKKQYDIQSQKLMNLLTTQQNSLEGLRKIDEGKLTDNQLDEMRRLFASIRRNADELNGLEKKMQDDFKNKIMEKVEAKRNELLSADVSSSVNKEDLRKKIKLLKTELRKKENIRNQGEFQNESSNLRKTLEIQIQQLKNDIDSLVSEVQPYQVKKNLTKAEKKLKEAEEVLLEKQREANEEVERLTREAMIEARNNSREEKKKYLRDKLAGLKLTNLNNRITNEKDIYGVNYINQVPTTDKKRPNENKDNVIFEGYKDENGVFQNFTVPITKDGYEFNDTKYPFDNYLLRASVSKRNINGEVTGSNITSNYRYDNEDIRKMIQDFEINKLVKRVENDEEYDPRQEKYQRRIFDGFGLTNNIIKHFNKDNKDMEKLSKSLKKHLKVEEKVDAPKKKGGAANFSARRIKIGKGLSPMEKEPIHKEFGKYIINMRQLKSGYLNLKHPSGSQIPSIPTVEVSKNYREFVLDVLENSKVNQRHYDILTNPEKAHFTNITKKAKLFDVLDFKAEENEEEKKDLERLELLFGEYNAGNDNPKMIKECKALIKKYIANGRIEQSRGLNMLMELD